MEHRKGQKLVDELTEEHKRLYQKFNEALTFGLHSEQGKQSFKEG